MLERSLEGGTIRGTGNGRRQGIPGFGTLLVENCKLLNVGSTRLRPIIRSMSRIITMDLQISGKDVENYLEEVDCGRNT